MSETPTKDPVRWQPAWTQAMTDFRGEDDEPGFDNVTVRMTVPAAFGGSRLRIELSNRFGDEPVVVGRASIGVDDQFFDAGFDEQPSTAIPARQSRWTDPIEVAVRHRDEVVVDLYLPEPTLYTTAGGFRFDRSTAGDHAGSRFFPLERSHPQVDESREFPATNSQTGPDGTGWSLPAGGPFLRTVETAGVRARAVVVALGGSSTAMGWPQYTADLLPADAHIAVLNRGIRGNRIRLDAPHSTPSWGRAGLNRFDEDVLGTAGVTHVVIAYNSNDWTLPGRVCAMDEMPSIAQLTDAYRVLVDRAQAAQLRVLVATVTPLAPELRADPDREGMRLALNDWIRTSGHEVVDFDAAIHSASDPSRLDARYAAPDDTHPSVNGSKRLAHVMVDALTRLQLAPAISQERRW